MSIAAVEELWLQGSGCLWLCVCLGCGVLKMGADALVSGDLLLCPMSL